MIGHDRRPGSSNVSMALFKNDLFEFSTIELIRINIKFERFHDGQDICK